VCTASNRRSLLTDVYQATNEKGLREVKTNIRTIMLATDFLQSSRLALDYAALLARKLDAKIVIVHAFELGPEASTVEAVHHIPSRTRKDAESRLAAFVAGVGRAGIAAESALIEGPVPQAILKSTEDFHADLLVLGTQGVHRGLSHLLIGSNTEALMLRSSCPTLTVGPHVLGGVDLDGTFRSIVYISNLTPHSAKAAPFAFQLSQLLAREIEVYQVVKEDETEVEQRLDTYCATMRSLLPEVKEEWCDPAFQRSKFISPADVLEKSQDPSILMVFGVEATPPLQRHLHASYAYQLLANAVCPIITVRSEV